MIPPKRAFKTCPVSKTGIAYIVCGISLFSAGMIRGELISAICGCALLLYALFCFVFAAIGAWRWKNVRFSLSWEGKDLAFLKLAAPAKMPERGNFFATASFESFFLVCPETEFVPPFTLSIPVSEPESRHQIATPPRGIYHSHCASVVIKDFSGFFKFAIFMPDSMNPEPLHVLPESVEPVSIPLPAGRTGVSQGKSTFHRSEELYETRPYMPGDDPRKINWKISAHTGTPVLREGELLPPPSTEYLFVFNTEIANPKVKHASVKKNFDLLVSRAAFVARSLAAQNKIISIARLNARGEADITTIHPGEPDANEALQKAFAEPQPERNKSDSRATPASSKQSGVFEGDAALLIFTMPENADAPEMESISKTNSLVVCGPATASPKNAAELLTLCRRFSAGGFNAAQI